MWAQDVIYLHLDETDLAATQLYRGLGFEPVRGVDPTGWYQELMFEAARSAGRKLMYYSKDVRTKKEEEEEDEGEEGDVE